MDSGDIYTANDGVEYPVTGFAPGNTYLFTAELLDNTGNSLTTPVVYTLTVIVVDWNDVPDLATLRAGTVDPDIYYRVTGPVTNTFSQSYRNQKYFQDATGGILIDDNDSRISSTYIEGDIVSNIRGHLAEFGGVLQLIPTDADWGLPSGNTPITPEVVDLATILAAVGADTYESEVVEIKGATFVGATGDFATGQVYPINDGTSDLDFRTSFYGADYIGQPVPLIPQNLVVLVAEYNGTPQVTARSLADVTLRVERDAINGFNVYPNPVTNGKLTINTFSNAEKEIQIYNILGKRVLSTKLKGSELNVKKLTSGIYVIKILEEGKTATRKLVIK